MASKHLKIQQVANFPPARHIHMVGIGGCGMSPLAHILLQQGYKVTGSDLVHSSVIQHLITTGAHIYIGHAANHITGADVVVYSSAMAPSNPELAAAQAARIPVIPRSRLLADVMAIKYGIVVAGSHGKTSTTGLIFWGLKHVKQRPSVIFGGRFQKEATSARLGNGPFMVVESDESDRSFLMLNPTVAVLTNIDEEHVSAYGTFEALKKSFLDFASRPPFYGFTILSADCPHSRDVARHLTHRSITFGFSKDAHIHIAKITPTEIHLQETNTPSTPNTSTPIPFHHPGEHNALNVAAAFATLRELGFSATELKHAFEDFPGIHRRLEKTSGRAPIHVWDDYAHHPTELRAVIQTMKQRLSPTQKLWLVFQPHRYSRFQEHHVAFASEIQACDHVVVLPVYAASERLPSTFDQTWLTFLNTLRQHHVSVHEVSGAHPLEQAFHYLKNHVPLHATVLCCGAGDITFLAHRLGAAIQKNRVTYEQPNLSA